MTKEQQLVLGNEVGFIFMPFTFKDAIEKYCTNQYKPEELKSLGTMGNFWSFIDSKYKTAVLIQDNKMTVIQPKDVKEGILTFVNFGIESIEVNYKSGKQIIKLEKSIFKQYMVGNIKVKFNNPFDHIILNFNNNIADPLNVKVDFKLYVEPVKEVKEELKDINATHRTGEDLVNVYFQKVSDKINRVEVELFIVDNKNESQLIGTYRVQDNVSFMSITGLAFGGYSYRVVQYVGSREVASSKKESFYLSRPNYGGKPTVINR
jgi:hypothetical protein